MAVVHRVPRLTGPRPDRMTPAVCSAVGVAAAVAAIVLQLLDPGVLSTWGVPIALTGIVLGIPHGAVDHMVPFWTAGRRPDARAVAVALGSYLAVTALAVLALLLVPLITVLPFLAVSAAHFGRADVVVAAERAGRAVRSPRHDLPLILAHGLIVIACPVLAWPADAAAVLGQLSPALATPLPTSVATTLGVATAVGVVGAVLWSVRLQRPREAAELMVVKALFVLVPPLAAFGIYFAGWHALRHTGRLLLLPGLDGEVPRPGPAARRYLAHAAVPTVVSLGAVLLLVQEQASSAAVGAALALLVALTFPHVLTVAALDRWAARGRPSGTVSRGSCPSRRPPAPACFRSPRSRRPPCTTA